MSLGIRPNKEDGCPCASYSRAYTPSYRQADALQRQVNSARS